MLRDGQVLHLSIGRAIIAEAVRRMDNRGRGCTARSGEYGNRSCPGDMRTGMARIVLGAGIDILNYALSIWTVIWPDSSRGTISRSQNGRGEG